MQQPRMVAPAARRSLWLLGLAVLALHLLLLARMSLPPVASAAAPPGALQTRVLAPPEPPATTPPPRAAAPQPAPQSKAAQRPALVRKAAPAPARPASKVASTDTATAAIAPAPATPDRSARLQAAYASWQAQQAATDPAATPHAPPTESLPTPLPASLPTVAARAEPVPAAAEAPAPAAPPAEPQAPLANKAPLAPKPAAAPLVLPPSTVLSFDAAGHVKGFNYQARATLTWQSDASHYQLRQQIRLFLLGSRAQESRGRITAQGLQPEQFVDEAGKTRRAELDFQAHQARFSDGEIATTALADGTQDRLSIFIQLGALMAAAPERYPRGTAITFATVGPRRIDPWTFTVAGPEVLHLPAGDIPALKLQRLPRGGDERRDTLWLGTELHYLPVRIRLAEAGGDFVDLRLSGHESP